MANILTNFDGRQNRNKKTLRQRMRFYFRRPIIYYCFGLPMIAPSICLILLSHTEGGLANSLIIGSFLLAMASVSVTTGVILGIRDCRKTSKLKSSKSINQGENNTSMTSTSLSCELNNRKSSRNNLDTCDASSSPSSRRSSSASLKSLNNTLTGVEKAKLISLKLKRKSMSRRKGKRGVKFPTEPLPPLTEEESFVKSLSRGNTSVSLKTEGMTKTDNRNNNNNNNNNNSSNNNNINNNKHADNRQNVGNMSVEELKDYLNVIGLGGGPQERLSKSFDDNRMLRADSTMSTKELPLTSKSRDTPMRSSSPSTKYPTVVTVSHERTGIRLP